MTIQIASPVLGAEERRNLLACLRSGWVSARGPFVEQFETAFRHLCRTRYAVAVSSGTAALHVSLAALGVERGDEVIVPALTFIATANAVTYTGARPRFADVDPVSWTLDPDAVRRCLTKRTRAIIAVHLFGHPAPLAPLRRLAQRHGLALIEDACQAEGAVYRGRPVGGIGDAGCFSFYGNKTLTTGEGGMLVTNDRRLWQRAQLLRDHGMSPRRRYWHPVIGFNYRLTNLQAALGMAQYHRLRILLRRRRAIATAYTRRLRRVPGLVLPSELAGTRHAYWMYALLVQRPFPLTRDALARRLARAGVETRPFFTPLHRQPPYRSAEHFPVAERLAREGLMLPSSSHLTSQTITKICRLIETAA
ncbi:MAG: DegT/DnrJ/EryC1/StrS family aminotransferase [Candidatus Omnitrophica bacterium]|nr:DegT/DnrJ/EryC1/StrS family aminotransferase [Candidatus Omnitrophota bacterium]